MCDCDYGEVRVEFKDRKTLSFVSDTIEKLRAHEHAALRLIFSTGCNITDHEKSLCMGENISILDMEAYCKLLGHLEHANASLKIRKVSDIDHQFIGHDRVMVFQEEMNEPYKINITDGRSTSKDNCIRINKLRMQSSNPRYDDPVILKFEDPSQPAQTVEKQALYGSKNEIISVEALVDDNFLVTLQKKDFDRLINSIMDFEY